MATISNFTFFNNSRLDNDKCSLDQRNIQNKSSSDYVLENYYPSCPMTSAIKFATNQPSVFYSASHQLGIGGCNVTTNSELKYTNLTRPKCKINLLERPFLTVPYLGRGSCNVDLESQIKQGDTLINKKSVNLTSETSHIKYRHYPLIPSIESSITNPNNLVESVAADDWVRGGVPSREVARTNTYQQS